MLIDTHAHLNFPQFEEDLDAVLQNAVSAGVTQIVNVGTNVSVSREAAVLAQVKERVFATAGIHPHDVEGVDDGAVDEIAGLLEHDRMVAVGETGLDFFRDYAPHDVQESVFLRHIEMSKRTGLPLVVHSRGAEDRVLELLESEGNGKVCGVLHCFGGNADQAQRGLDLGFYLGFGGTVTFKNSSALSVALGVPNDRLLLETDCPYLAPVPHRGKRNEPAYVRDVAVFLAEKTGETLAELSLRATKNACRLFRLPDVS
ncbi:MAG: TatD family hydrolase [bacterium]|nr:TatD family hydrolase [bacterium]